jgi:flagellar motility protein MotE (MotC chaperone)
MRPTRLRLGLRAAGFVLIAGFGAPVLAASEGEGPKPASPEPLVLQPAVQSGASMPESLVQWMRQGLAPAAQAAPAAVPPAASTAAPEVKPAPPPKRTAVKQQKPAPPRPAPPALPVVQAWKPQPVQGLNPDAVREKPEPPAALAAVPEPPPAPKTAPAPVAAADSAPAPKPAQKAAPAPPAGPSDVQQYCANIAPAAAEAEAVWQARKLLELDTRLKGRIAELEAKRAEYKDWLEKREAFLRKAEEGLVAIYSRMKPEAAALQLAAMEDGTAAAVLARLNSRAASAILNEMTPGRAARLTGHMAGSATRDGKKT